LAHRARSVVSVLYRATRWVPVRVPPGSNRTGQPFPPRDCRRCAALYLRHDRASAETGLRWSEGERRPDRQISSLWQGARAFSRAAAQGVVLGSGRRQIHHTAYLFRGWRFDVLGAGFWQLYSSRTASGPSPGSIRGDYRWRLRPRHPDGHPDARLPLCLCLGRLAGTHFLGLGFLASWHLWVILILGTGAVRQHVVRIPPCFVGYGTSAEPLRRAESVLARPTRGGPSCPQPRQQARRLSSLSVVTRAGYGCAHRRFADFIRNSSIIRSPFSPSR
jgi:hypothetical protein